MAKHNELGKAGEEIAAGHLERRGYRILARNWRIHRDELDIIAKKDGKLIVVEVKTRSTAQFGEPETAVTPGKIRSIVRATEEYIMMTDYNGETQFDVIGILLGEGKMQMNHIEDAFSPRL